MYKIISDHFKVTKLDRRCYFYHVDATDLHLIVSKVLENPDLKIRHFSESRCRITQRN